MYANTHIYISKTAIEETKGDNIDLNEKLFLLGSVVPDYSPMHKVIRHYIDDSYEYINSLLSKVIEFTSINKISFYLGVISHYIADYFCSPHYNNMSFLSKDVFEHIRYEYQLNKFIETNIVTDIKTYNFSDLDDLIESKMNDYANKYSFVEDLKFAINSIINMIANLGKWGLVA